MAGQNDADDLIAELTRLMANDAKPATPDSSKAAAPAAESPPAPGGPTIRIPGISTPVPTNGQGAARFDFGRPATPSPVASPEPLASWQDRIGSKPANAQPSTPSPPALDSRTIAAPPEEPWRPAIPPGEAERDATPAFDFDFGFNRTRPDAPAPAASRPVPAPAPSPAATPVARFETAPRSAPSPVSRPAPPPAAPAAAPPPDHDAIAELIAQELGVASTPAVPPTPVASPVAAFGPTPSVAVPQPAPAPVQPQPRSGPRPAPVPESDRFQTAPVFGLGGRPSEPPKPAAPDPMDEIEDLIGEAVRVDLTPPQQPQPARGFTQPVTRQVPAPMSAPSPEPRGVPAVPPLNAQFAPRRTSSLRDAEDMRDADEAILAAAAASGAEVGHVDSEFDDDRPRRGKQRRRRVEAAAEPQPRGRDRERKQGSTFRSLVVPAVLGTILVAGGFALYWGVATSHHDSKTPVLTADATPAKEVPPKPATTDDSHSVVMDQLGGTAPAPSKETLVSRDQTAGGDATAVASDATTAAATPPADTANDATDNGLANRKVRTVTVRPDGTIVSADDSVAGGAQLPVNRPNVPAVPGAAPVTADSGSGVMTSSTPTASDPIAAAIASADNGSGAGSATPAAASPSVAETTPAPTPMTAAPASDATASAGTDTPVVGQPDPNAPIPLPPPHRSALSSESAALAPDTTVPSVAPLADPTGSAASRPSSSVNAVIRSGNAASAQPVDLLGSNSGTAAKPPAKTVQAATADTTGAVSAGTPGAGHVQLSSQTSQAAAQSSAASLQKRFGSLFGGAQLQVVQADLGAKGIYYRVMLPTASAQDAVSICTQIKSSGGDCVANR